MSISISGNGSITGVLTSYTFDKSVSIGGTLTYEDVTNVDSVGIITAQSGVVISGGVLSVPDGSESTPSIQFSGSGTDTGFYSPAADEVAVSTGGSGRLFIDSSGKVGIGTTSPSVLLHVKESTGAHANLILENSEGTAKLGTNSNVFYVESSQHIFYSGGGTTEYGRFDSSGRLLVGTPSTIDGELISSYGSFGTGVGLRVQNNSAVNGAGTIISSVNPSGSTSSQSHFQGNTSGVSNWYLLGNGTITYSSDQRLKKNIETTRDGYLEDLQKLRVVKYHWKYQEDSQPKELGFIAQEVEQIFPGLIQDDLKPISQKDQTVYKTLKGSVLPIIAVKALQEAALKIQNLEDTIVKLESRLSALEAQ